ncbi:MAG TPA: sulfurtransferase [Betaproteobacteria bacterium]|nr:sulfurtransferase [Betaproteobacteria bacterium]
MKTKNILILAPLLVAGTAVASAAPPPLVSAQWVAANACKPGVAVIDIRSPVGGGGNLYTYLRGHIPCAVYSNYKTAGWRVKSHGVVGMLPPTPKLEKLIGDLGVGNANHVVIYSAGTNALDMGSATRVFWTFKMLGDNNISILNGGYAGYVAKKLPVKRGKHTRKATHFAAHFQPQYLATEQDVEHAVNSGAAALVDNRPHAQYIGVVTPHMDKRAGTLPGAKNLPQGWITVNDGGAFRSPAQLEALYKVAGVPVMGKQITFCNTGHWASLGWFASSQLLGNKDVKVYDGSMAQWTRNSKLPLVVKVKLPASH